MSKWKVPEIKMPKNAELFTIFYVVYHMDVKQRGTQQKHDLQQVFSDQCAARYE